MQGLQRHKTGLSQLESRAAEKAEVWVGILGYQVLLRGQEREREDITAKA